jgi:hypothetical protein
VEEEAARALLLSLPLPLLCVLMYELSCLLAGVKYEDSRD